MHSLRLKHRILGIKFQTSTLEKIHVFKVLKEIHLILFPALMKLNCSFQGEILYKKEIRSLI